MTEADPPDPSAAQNAGSPAQSLETRVLRGAGWIALGFGSRQVLSWVSMLVLVRLLDPTDFGLMALAFTVIAALQYVRGSGIWSALVFMRSGIEDAAASAFAYLVVSSAVIYALCFATAPLFARVFDASELTPVIQGLALLVVFGGLGIVPGAIIERDLRYAATARVDLGGALVQVTLSIGLAAAGAGVWSLVAGQLGAAAFETAALWFLAPWRPSLRSAHWADLRSLLRYGRFAGAANVATFLGSTADNLVVGRILGATQVGFYAVTFRLATIPESVVGYVIGKAMFPAYSILQEDVGAFRAMLLQHLQRLVLLVLPITVFIAIAAEPIVLALLGSNWLPVVTPLRILAGYGFVRSLTATTSAVFRGAGKPELAMGVAVANLVLLVPALIVLTYAYGLEGTATAMLICLVVATVPAFRPLMRLLDISLADLFRSLRQPLACSAVLAAALALLVSATASARPAVALVVLVVSGSLIYMASTALLARSVVVPMWLDLRGHRT